LRNLFGIKDSNQPLTRQQWEWAKRWYTKLYHFDNNMTEFFNMVVNPDAFLKYMNKVVPAAVPALGIYGLSNNNEKAN
jgi:hypothetical protein